jgi:hypothetical protein
MMKTAAKRILLLFWLLTACLEVLVSALPTPATSAPKLNNADWQILSLSQSSRVKSARLTNLQTEGLRNAPRGTVVLAPSDLSKLTRGLARMPLGPESNAESNVSSVAPSQNTTLDLSASDSWANLTKLQEHFEDHGADFGATSPEEYARMASDFLQQSQTMGLPTKIDPTTGVIRVRSRN